MQPHAAGADWPPGGCKRCRGLPAADLITALRSCNAMRLGCLSCKTCLPRLLLPVQAAWLGKADTRLHLHKDLGM